MDVATSASLHISLQVCVLISHTGYGAETDMGTNTGCPRKTEPIVLVIYLLYRGLHGSTDLGIVPTSLFKNFRFLLICQFFFFFYFTFALFKKLMTFANTEGGNQSMGGGVTGRMCPKIFFWWSVMHSEEVFYILCK